MHIQDIVSRDATTLSFEFFPPKNEEAATQLETTLDRLESLNPSFVDLTYGAGGSTRDLTVETVIAMKRRRGIPVVPHLTTVCQKEPEIRRIVETYAEAGIGNILALRGDPPREKPDHDRSTDDFEYAADLVRYLRAFGESGRHPDPRGFGIGVAGFPEGHPDTPQRVRELEFLKAKCDAGADYICTQFFFDNRDFHDFRARCEWAGIDVPIVAGVMPITGYRMYERLPDFALGARYPAELIRQVEAVKENDEEVAKVGLAWCLEQCRDLLEHEVRGLHFYTLNQAEATLEVCGALGLAERSGAKVES